MYPNQPQQPQNLPPQQPQGGTPPYPPQQPYSQPAPGVSQQPQQQAPYGQPQQSTYQQGTTQFQPQQPQPSQQPSFYEEQPSLVPEGMASIDYLNQISAQKTNNGFTRKQIALFGGLLLLAFGALAAFMIANGGGRGQNITELSQTLIVRIGALAEVAKETQANAKNQSLSNTNSAIAIQLTSAQSALSTALEEAGVSVAKPRKDIVAAESNEELLNKFDDAHLSGIFDRVYSREMSYQLERTMLLINDIHSRTKNTDLKEKLEESYKNIEPLQKQLADFSDKNG